MRSGTTTQCEECGADTYRHPSQTPARWCSWECRTAVQRIYPTRASKVQLTCKQCGLAYSRPQKKAHSKFCSVDCAGRYNGRAKTLTRISVACQQCGEQCKHGGIVGVPPSIAPHKKFCSHRCAALGRPITGSSKIADAALDIWRSDWNGEPFETEYRVNRWSIDLAFPHLKFAIELDGVYWHSLPEMVRKDARKDAALSADGWIVRRITIRKETTPTQLAAEIATVTKELQWTRC